MATTVAKRIGEILLAHGWVEPKVLERALVKQRETRRRLCSLLIDSGLLTLDEGSRALGAQHGVLAALHKHLAGRDHALARCLPAALARALIALPLGRMGTGAVIVCVREPAPAIAARLAEAMNEQVVLAVAPASPLEALVREAYPETHDAHDAHEALEEFDVDLHTGPIATLDDAVGDAMHGIGALQLVELDDAGVSKQPMLDHQLPTQAPARTTTRPLTATRPTRSSLPATSAARPTTSALPPATTSRPVMSGLSAVGIAVPRTVTPPSLPVTLAATLAALARATTRDQAADAAIAFAATRWAASLLATIAAGAATGYRGHGPRLSAAVVEAVSVPTSAASIIKVALDTGTLATTPPPDADASEARLEHLLGLPRRPAAIAIGRDQHPAHVLVVGDPLIDDADAAAADLRRLATALATAFARLAAP